MSGGSIRKRNGRYQGRYRVGGQLRSKTFRLMVDAENWLSTEMASVAEGRWIDPRSGKTRFETYAMAWLETRTNRPNTINDYERQLRNHILPTFGDHPIAAIRATELQAWLKGLEKTLAPSTVEKVWRVMVMVFKGAERDRIIAFRPTHGISPPKPEKRIIEPLSIDEVQALLAASSDRYRALIALAAGSGLRQGECFGVTSTSLQMLRRRVLVNRQIVQIGTRPEWGPPKTAASVRTVPLADVTLEYLAEHQARFPLGPDGVLFTNAEGRFVRRSSFCVMWNRLVKRSDVDRPRVTFHELRHHYASLLIYSGNSAKVVQSRLGHASISETMDTYTHLWPDDEEGTRSAIQEAMTGNVR